MNERIQELAKHLNWEEVGADYLGTVSDICITTHEFTKFAELIVRECAEVAACNAHVSGFSLGDLIKKHFGVGE